MADAKLAGIYSPLDPLEGEIRLIHLQPYPSGLRVTCSLHVARLVDVAGQYEALSYEWGPPISEMETISIEEKFFAVRPNLYLALEHLRLQSDIRVLWIDALCIDQADEKERNHQVSKEFGIRNTGINHLGSTHGVHIFVCQSCHCLARLAAIFPIHIWR